MVLLNVCFLLMGDRVDSFGLLHEVLDARRLYIFLIGIESFDGLGPWGLSLHIRRSTESDSGKTDLLF